MTLTNHVAETELIEREREREREDAIFKKAINPA
jgi:hypothetical protein